MSDGLPKGKTNPRSEITAFYTPDPPTNDGLITLAGDEAHHALTVCRLTRGQQITIVDGRGLAFFAEVVSLSRGEGVCRVYKSVKNWGEPPLMVDLAAGLSAGSKFDWVCEKATELGAAAIIPFTSERSLVKVDDPRAAKRKLARYRRLTLAAMKQTLRCRWPQVQEFSTLTDLPACFEEYHRVLIADASGGAHSFDGVGEFIGSARKILLIVGPEGGFSSDEIERLRQSGARSFSLGPRRLRTETAAITFLARVMGVVEP